MRKRLLAIVWMLLMLLAAGNAQNASPRRQPETIAPATASPLYDQKTVAAGKYNGPGGCAASSCHGSVQPKTTTRIFQNEYTIWIAQDKHARAFSVLQNNVSRRIAQNSEYRSHRLKRRSAWPATRSTSLPSSRRRPSSLADGVSCENCHGPASGWLGPHTTKNWPYEKSLQLGMYDTRNLEKRSHKMPDLPSGYGGKICRSRNDRRRTSRSYL